MRRGIVGLCACALFFVGAAGKQRPTWSSMAASRQGLSAAGRSPLVYVCRMAPVLALADLDPTVVLFMLPWAVSALLALSPNAEHDTGQTYTLDYWFCQRWWHSE